MSHHQRSIFLLLLYFRARACLVSLNATVNAQTSYTWDEVKTKFEAANPTLKADESNVHFSGPARAGRRHGEGCEKADLVAADEQLNTLGVWLASGLIRQMLGRNT